MPVIYTSGAYRPASVTFRRQAHSSMPDVCVVCYIIPPRRRLTPQLVTVLIVFMFIVMLYPVT